jgi:hypothetical protein
VTPSAHFVAQHSSTLAGRLNRRFIQEGAEGACAAETNRRPAAFKKLAGPLSLNSGRPQPYPIVRKIL